MNGRLKHVETARLTDDSFTADGVILWSAKSLRFYFKKNRGFNHVSGRSFARWETQGKKAGARRC